MPGYNHYSWCVCGWCYKTRSNGYSASEVSSKFDHWSAERFLQNCGASRSWSACFVAPNASCPVCSAKVYYYQNEYGSRVFFDELGWPWPKHPCTDNTIQTKHFQPKSQQIVVRARGATTEILEAAKTCQFDPNGEFRSKFGNSPWDLLIVVRLIKVGFENRIEARSISPLLDDPLYIAFTSSKEAPVVGNFFGFDGQEVSILDPNFKPKRYKAKAISKSELEPSEPKGPA